LIAQSFGVVDQLFIVFANDAADWRSDAANSTYNRYSGGSRVVSEGKLSPRALKRAAWGMGIVLLGGSALVGLVAERPTLPLLAALAVLLLWAYSYPPLRLSYRGGGEFLQALGVGAVLPVVGFYLQAGSLEQIPWLALVPSLLLGWAGNLTTALPDAPSDRAAGKRTFAVRRGELRARRASLAGLLLATAATPWVLRGASPLALVCSMLVPLVLVVLNASQIRSADAENHAVCERFVLFNGASIGALYFGWSAVLFAVGP